MNISPSFSIVAGWIGILASFVSGMFIGLLVFLEKFQHDYSSRQRQYIRLGHISLAALGVINILTGICISLGHRFPQVAQILMVFGLISMPLACFVYAYNSRWFYLFSVPSAFLVIATILILGRYL